MANANDYQVGGNHYRAGVQHWDYVVTNDIPYLEAQVIKYLARWRKKSGPQDLFKARHFLQKVFEVNGLPWTDPPTEKDAYPAGTSETASQACAQKSRDDDYARSKLAAEQIPSRLSDVPAQPRHPFTR